MSSPAAEAVRSVWTEANEQAWSAFDHLPSVVLVTDTELRCRYANAAGLRWLGAAGPAEILGRPGQELLGPEVWQAALPSMEEALSGRPQQALRSVADATGHTVHAHATYAPYRRDGQVVGLLVQITDVTAPLEAERQLRREAEEAAVLEERERVAAEATTLVSRPLFAASLELSAILQATAGMAQRHVEGAIRDIDTALAELRALVVGYVPPAVMPASRADALSGEALSGEPTAELVAANVGDMVCTADAQGRFEWVSPSSTMVTGWAPKDLIGRSIFDLVHPDDEPLLRARWAEQVTGAALVGVEYRRSRPDGSYQWVEARIRPLHGTGGTVVGSVASVRDVGERHRLEAELAEALETFELSFVSAPIGKALVGADGRWLKVNPALSAIVGRTSDDLLTGSFQDITHPDDIDGDMHLVGEVLRGERDHYEIEKRYLRPDGREVWVLLSVAAARRRDGSFRFFIVQVQDIGRRKADAEALQRRADHDPLTGLWNRRRFADALTACYGPRRRASDRPVLLVCDLDGFKAINDTYGHAAGDAHLREVAAVLHDTVRTGDGCARLGGDEFAVLLSDADPDTAAAIADRITASVAALDRGGVSVGSAPWHPDQDLDDWLSRADRAMYGVKAAVRT